MIFLVVSDRAGDLIVRYRGEIITYTPAVSSLARQITDTNKNKVCKVNIGIVNCKILLCQQIFRMNWREEMTSEEDEEQLVMRRLRNSVDDLRRGMRSLTYKVTVNTIEFFKNIFCATTHFRIDYSQCPLYLSRWKKSS